MHFFPKAKGLPSIRPDGLSLTENKNLVILSFCVVPGSSNPKHIQENIEVFDFELTPEEMAKMASLNQEKRYFTMNYQQIKAWMENYELWD